MAVLKRTVLGAEFYDRPTLEVARGLLGKFLVRQPADGREIAVAIHETEAYDGFEDKASHAHRGVTPRNSVMYGPPGYFYVYICYGMHWLLNVVTGPNEFPAAVLIRGAGEYVGPARLTKNLSIDRAFNRQKATERKGLWIEDRGLRPRPKEIELTPRIGVNYAGPEWSRKHYRFVWPEGIVTKKRVSSVRKKH